MLLDLDRLTFHPRSPDWNMVFHAVLAGEKIGWTSNLCSTGSSRPGNGPPRAGYTDMRQTFEWSTDKDSYIVSNSSVTTVAVTVSPRQIRISKEGKQHVSSITILDSRLLPTIVGSHFLPFYQRGDSHWIPIYYADPKHHSGSNFPCTATSKPHLRSGVSHMICFRPKLGGLGIEQALHNRA